MNMNMPVQPMGHDVKHTCQSYMNYHVIAHLTNGTEFDGILEGMDEEGVTMLVPEEVDERGALDTRQYGFGPGRYRRYRRARFPYRYFGFPFFRPYPYFYLPYPPPLYPPYPLPFY